MPQLEIGQTFQHCPHYLSLNSGIFELTDLVELYHEDDPEKNSAIAHQLNYLLNGTILELASPPKEDWDSLLDFLRKSPVFLKCMATQNFNSWSLLLTTLTVTHQKDNFIKSFNLVKSGLPQGVSITQEEKESLNKTLQDCGINITL